MNDDSSYKTILKRISAFGGVQVLNVLLALIRGKFIALLLGPQGMGIASLFNSSTATIQQLAGLGLNVSAVREIAAAGDDPDKLRPVLAAVTRLILLTSLLGAALCALLAPLLSRWSFGGTSYTTSFILLAASVFFMIAGTGYLAMLQGLGEVKRLSKASLVGGLTGLLGGVPLYYFFGTAGIVPAIILMTCAVFLFYYISFRKCLGIEPAPFSMREHLPLAKRLISLGLVLMISSLAGSLITYVVNIFIRTYGTVADVGLYQAANSLTLQYAAIIFNALALDYFPRLSAIAADNNAVSEAANRQTEIVLLLLTPLAIGLIALAPLVIRLLLTSEFLPIIPLVRWMSLGMLVQGAGLPLGYIYLAKADRRAYVMVELIWSNALWIACSILFYYLYGLVGLGVSYAIRCALDNVVNYLLCRHRYRLRYTRSVWRITLLSALPASAALALALTETSTGEAATWMLLAAAVSFSAYRLRYALKTK